MFGASFWFKKDEILDIGWQHLNHGALYEQQRDVIKDVFFCY